MGSFPVCAQQGDMSNETPQDTSASVISVHMQSKFHYLEFQQHVHCTDSGEHVFNATRLGVEVSSSSYYVTATTLNTFENNLIHEGLHFSILQPR